MIAQCACYKIESVFLFFSKKKRCQDANNGFLLHILQFYAHYFLFLFFVILKKY